nr:MAG TPA: hypothetical protein [Bacteriophage sp.]
MNIYKIDIVSVFCGKYYIWSYHDFYDIVWLRYYFFGYIVYLGQD